MLNPVTFSLTDAAGVQSQVTASHPDYVAFEMKYDKPVIEQLVKIQDVEPFLVIHCLVP